MKWILLIFLILGMSSCGLGRSNDHIQSVIEVDGDTFDRIKEEEMRKRGIHPQTNRAFYPHIENFLALSKKYNRNDKVSYPIFFADPEEIKKYFDNQETGGYCETEKIRDQKRTFIRPIKVVINKTWWNKSFNNNRYGELLREIVLFHEMGHCSLMRDHDDFNCLYNDDRIERDDCVKKKREKDKENKKISLSIMSSLSLYAPYYKKYRESYLRELFTKSKDDF